MAQDTLQVPGSGRFETVGSVYSTDVDIVAVPAVGADWKSAWIDDSEGLQKPWLVSDLRECIENARVLLFDHGRPSEQDDFNSLGQKLLTELHKERRLTSPKRPIIFICHSTGGIIATSALVLASQSSSSLESILSSCHGIAFIATPHLGSSYLSTPEFAQCIHRLLELKYHIPARLRDLLKPGRKRLKHLANEFKSVSADMKVWTFLETADSSITVSDTESGNMVEIHAPITSIRSGLLDLEHEKEIPLVADHRSAAYFKGQASSTRASFLRELQSTVTAAVRLSAEPEIPLDVEDEVPVQVNGFFEDTALGVSNDTPLKLWSTTVSLQEYLRKGPAACLRDRIRSTDKLRPGSGDNTSISDLGSRPMTIYSSPAEDIDSEASCHPDSDADSFDSTLPNKSRLRAHLSPTIHITEPDAEGDSEVPGGREKSSDCDSLPENPEGEASRTSKRSSIIKKLKDRARPRNAGLLIPTLKVHNEDRLEMLPPKRAPRFDRPDPDTEKLMWIHVPYTNTAWVPQVLSKACMDRRNPSVLHRFMSEENWYSYHTRARHLEPHARFVRPACLHSKTDTAPANAGYSLEDRQLALYLPYLHWDTYFSLTQRRKVVDQRLDQGRSRPVPEKISQSSLESKLIWKYLGFEPPIHFRRTLDQFGYPNLRSTVARDDDQMLWKRTRKEVNLKDELGESPQVYDISSMPEPFMDGKVLMVDQLWLWIVDQRTLVTFFPRQEATTSEGKLYEQANLHNSIYNELNGDLARRFETAGDLAALIVLHAATVLLDRTLHHDLQILRIFEESISILTESLTKSFKRFRRGGFVARPADHNRTPEGKRMTAAERDERDIQMANQNRKDLSSLLELRDIIDELGTIMKLLDQQKATIKSMIQYYGDKAYGQDFLDNVQVRLDEYRNQVSEMKENAHFGQKAVETLLDLKQKQANVDEARMARWEAEVTQNQSRSVMVFTVFTVIFLPLSFFTSLFGINAREWSGEQKNLTLGTMLIISGPTSIALIALTLLLAFSETLRTSVWKTRKIAIGMIRDFLLHPVRDTLHLGEYTQKIPSAISNDSAMKDRLDRYFGYRRHRKQFLEDDIWKTHEDRAAMPPPIWDYEMGKGKGSRKDGYFDYDEEKMRIRSLA